MKGGPAAGRGLHRTVADDSLLWHHCFVLDISPIAGIDTEEGHDLTSSACSLSHR